MRRLFLVLLIIPSLVFADGEIRGPASVPVHTLATVATDIEADDYIWLATPLESTYPAIQVDPSILQFAGAPGAHEIILIPLKGGKPIGRFSKVVTFGVGPTPPPPGPVPGPGPGPAPDPGPEPGPGPLPVGEKLHVSLVLETDDNSVPIALLRTDPKIREAAEQLGFSFRSYDDDQADIARLNLGKAIQDGGGVPVLIVQAPSGAVLGSIKCPTTADEVIAYIRKFRSP